MYQSFVGSLRGFKKAAFSLGGAMTVAACLLAAVLKTAGLQAAFFVTEPELKSMATEESLAPVASDDLYTTNQATILNETTNALAVDNYVYLPLVAFPFTVAGEIEINSSRFAGLTSFIPKINLDFGSMTFPAMPDEMKVWREGQQEPGWQPYSATVEDIQLEPAVIGAQQINARFRKGSAETPITTAIVFYLPNGDFAQGINGLSGWELADNGLPYSISNNQLRLGSNAYGCDNMPFPASAQAAFTLDVPEGAKYLLNVEAVIYTYDKLPNPDQDIYDAFEVHVNNIISRHGYSGSELLNCSTERQVNINATYLLPAGSAQVSLENHSRFDRFYNTYTDISKVWISK